MNQRKQLSEEFLKKTTRVLIVDDNRAFREQMKRLLRREPDMEVVDEAANGHEGVAKAHGHLPDVILMDISMPGISGLDATKQLTKEIPEVIIVIVTIHEQQMYRELALANGALGYVAKKRLQSDLIPTIRASVKKGRGLTPEDPGGEPAEKAGKPKAKIERGPTVVPQRKTLVLVVEDDEGSRKLISFFLRHRYDISFAVSVEEAKQRLNSEPIEIILLDLSLIGEEDGLDLVRFLRKSRKWKNVPIIATTAHAFQADRENCLAAGCSDYLAKPLTQKELLGKIKQFF